jgi:kynurenine 3-monooxygenase
MLALAPNLVREFMERPTGSLVTTRTTPWHYKGRVGLIGDACHAVFPFYGQGMNAAFEDCSVLDDCIEQHHDNWEAAFGAYQQRRKRHTDTLADLSKQNFIELRDRVQSPWFIARKKADIMLNRVFPKNWSPLYTMIAHTTIPYAEALERAKRQDMILRWIGGGVAMMTIVSVLGVVRSIARTWRVVTTE